MADSKQKRGGDEVAPSRFVRFVIGDRDGNEIADAFDAEGVKSISDVGAICEQFLDAVEDRIEFEVDGRRMKLSEMRKKWPYNPC